MTFFRGNFCIAVWCKRLVGEAGWLRCAKSPRSWKSVSVQKESSKLMERSTERNTFSIGSSDSVMLPSWWRKIRTVFPFHSSKKCYFVILMLEGEKIQIWLFVNLRYSEIAFFSAENFELKGGCGQIGFVIDLMGFVLICEVLVRLSDKSESGEQRSVSPLGIQRWKSQEMKDLGKTEIYECRHELKTGSIFDACLGKCVDSEIVDPVVSFRWDIGW